MANTARTTYLNALADQACNVPDEMLMTMIDAAAGDATAEAILAAELDARTAPPFRGLATILAARGL